MPHRVIMVAGEASGDMHGAGVVRELLRRDPSMEIFGIGGDMMQQEGMDLVYHISRLSFMGFAEVVRNLPTIRDVQRIMSGLLKERRPDVVLLIDYPGFNLRFASTAKKAGVPVVYYISPQVWAWHKSRVKRMRGVIDRMAVVFPFEVPIYQGEDVPVEFVGHPIVERIGSAITRDEFFAKHGLVKGRKLLGLFPGSRRQEIERILPIISKAAARLQKELGVQTALGVAPNLGWPAMRDLADQEASIVPVENATYDLMHHADAAIVTSGTATLETGWFGTPMVIVYRTSAATFQIGKRLVGVPCIGLVNIVAGKKIVPELIQHDMSVENLVALLTPLLTDEQANRAMRASLAGIRSMLGGPGASARVAETILELAQSKAAQREAR